jgi:hypothetical protein
MKRLARQFHESAFDLWMGTEITLRAGMEEGYTHGVAVD